MKFTALLIIDENGNPRMEMASTEEQEVRDAAEPYKAHQEQFRPTLQTFEVDL